MFRQLARPAFRASRLPATRSFSVAAVRMTEGSTGAPRPGGEHSGDIWTKKGSAEENLYMKKKEHENSIGGGVGSLTLARLLILKEKLKQQRAHLDELDAHIDSITKNQGGEQN
ncbi:ATPase inhibitor [Microsporum canis]